MSTQTTYTLATLASRPSATGGVIVVGAWPAPIDPRSSPRPEPEAVGGFRVDVAIDPSNYDPANPAAFTSAQVAAVHAVVDAYLTHQDTEALLLRLAAQFNGVVLQHTHTSP